MTRRARARWPDPARDPEGNEPTLDSNPPISPCPPGAPPASISHSPEGRTGNDEAPVLVGGGDRPRRRRPSLLVVDDEPEVLRSVHDLFRLDYHVITRGSGDAALEILLSEDEIHVIMSDQRMPGMTGV